MSANLKSSYLPADPTARQHRKFGISQIRRDHLYRVGAHDRRSRPSTANACACGCSVFDVGGGLLPQEDDHGGRIFTEWWHPDQNQNWIGNSKAAAAAQHDKQMLTDWYNVGLDTCSTANGACMVRVPTSPIAISPPTPARLPDMGIQTFNSRSCRRRRSDGHVHRIFQGHVHRPHLRSQAADRHLHGSWA